jgi:hypothetical protein
MALNFFASVQAFVERSGLGGQRRAQLLVEQLYQLLVVLERPAAFAQGRLAAHQAPVGLLQEPVVGYGLPVRSLPPQRGALRRRGAAPGGAAPPHTPRREPFLADHHSVCPFRSVVEIVWL